MHSVLEQRKQWQKQYISIGKTDLFYNSMGLRGNFTVDFCTEIFYARLFSFICHCWFLKIVKFFVTLPWKWQMTNPWWYCGRSFVSIENKICTENNPKWILTPKLINLNFVTHTEKLMSDGQPNLMHHHIQHLKLLLLCLNFRAWLF